MIFVGLLDNRYPCFLIYWNVLINLLKSTIQTKQAQYPLKNKYCTLYTNPQSTEFTYSQTPLGGLYLHFITTVHTILHITDQRSKLRFQRQRLHTKVSAD